jgi:hypothetical protein
MQLHELINLVADILKEVDASRPVFRHYKPGVGPFGEPQLVGKISELLKGKGSPCLTHKHPDLTIGAEWALEFKIVRPFGDNGKEAENWSVNLLHPYPGCVSAIGDAFGLMEIEKEIRSDIRNWL